MSESIIKVGVGCLVFKDDKLLLGKRRSDSHGNGEYSSGGGHVEYMEELADAARREIQEEWGIEISNPEFVCLVGLRKYDKHYMSIGFRANWVSGEPQLQPDGEFEDFGWYDLDALPSPLFGAIGSYIEAIRTGRQYIDIDDRL
jgi:8-oxo-dGTP diphosphatase